MARKTFCVNIKLIIFTNQFRYNKNFKKFKTRFFSGPKMFLLCLKSIPWTGDELAGDDAENCENS